MIIYAQEKVKVGACQNEPSDRGETTTNQLPTLAQRDKKWERERLKER
jgi:hypothetical protein